LLRIEPFQMMYEHPLSERMSKEWLTEVKIDGKWMVYGICSEGPNTRLIKGEYLGMSNEIRIDGRAQKPRPSQLHFWKNAGV